MTKKTEKHTRVRARVVKLDDDLRQRGIETNLSRVAGMMDDNPNDEVVAALASTTTDTVEDLHRRYEDKLIGIARVQELAGIKKSEVDRRVRAGTFPAPKVAGDGKDRKWSHIEVMAWITEQARKPAVK